jgi:hypothetical protein
MLGLLLPDDSNSVPFLNNQFRSRPERITDPTRQKMLFKHIVQNTDSVAIGPLEYCGNGLTIRSSHRVKL